MELKGQVTIFVALGVVVLILAGLAVFLLQPRTETFQSDIQEVEEIHNLVEQCLEISLKEAIINSGQNGGWVNLNSAELEFAPSPTDASYLSYSPNTLPYWYYSRPCNNGAGICSYSKQPPLCKTYNCVIEGSYGSNSVQKQIEDYIEEKARSCADLSIYEDRVDTSRGQVVASVEIAENSVIANVIWPHNFEQLDKKESFQDFVVSQDVNLGKMYKLASAIVDQEKYQGVFASQTMSMISLYSGIEEELPPTAEASFNLFGGERIWVKQQVANDIEYDIIPLMSLFQVKDTLNYNPISGEDIFDTGIYSGFDLGFIDDYSNFEARVVVPAVKPAININGGQEVIRPTKLTENPNLIMQMLGLGIVRYQTSYDITYPLIVQVNDPRAFNGEGFSFNTAFEVNIDNNAPGTHNFVSEEDEGLPLPEGSGITLEDFDEEQFKFTIKNKYTNDPINNTLITYTCGEEYSLGLTDENGVLITNMPFCYAGGLLKFFKSDYAIKEISYNHDGEENEIREFLYKIQQKEVALFKYDTLTAIIDGGSVIGEPLRLEENDFALIILEPLEQDWPPTQVITFGKGEGISNTFQNEIVAVESDYGIELADANFSNDNYTINIVPGEYAVEIVLLHDDPIHLDADEVCPVSRWFDVAPPVYIINEAGCKDLPEQDFEIFPKGGGIASIEFLPDWVYQDNTFIFTAQQLTVPKDWNDIKNDDELPHLGVWSPERQIDPLVTFTYR